mmetsp:Transcript_7608/g.14302  ORF Transcript_7608/g.14302 Transcript_7608/m.14302 type:complete len:229 (+) Transcript_7608:5302-5988(+)
MYHDASVSNSGSAERFKYLISTPMQKWLTAINTILSNIASRVNSTFKLVGRFKSSRAMGDTVMMSDRQSVKAHSDGDVSPIMDLICSGSFSSLRLNICSRSAKIGFTFFAEEYRDESRSVSLPWLLAWRDFWMIFLVTPLNLFIIDRLFCSDVCASFKASTCWSSLLLTAQVCRRMKHSYLRSLRSARNELVFKYFEWYKQASKNPSASSYLLSLCRQQAELLIVTSI